MKARQAKRILAVGVLAAALGLGGLILNTGGKISGLDQTSHLQIQKKKGFVTNLSGLNYDDPSWSPQKDGLHSTPESMGEYTLLSETMASDFVFATDVTFLENRGSAGIIFRSNSSSDAENAYEASFSASMMTGCFSRLVDGVPQQLCNDVSVDTSEDGIYHLKVVAIHNWISFYVNDILVGSSGDYTLTPDDRGQNTCPNEGYLGLLNEDSSMVFQNTLFIPIEGENDPTLTDITVSSSVGTVETKPQFSPNEPITIWYVDNDAETVDIETTSANEGSVITVTGPDGQVYEDGKNIPVAVGKNYITVESSMVDPSGITSTLTYRVNVHRRDEASVYYNEPHRDQYHYSVKDGWGNDPNGLIYYKGTYHLFYQFYDDIVWGPMHWAHATSTDMIHWEEQPMALYPDANGTMFSGCIVADETNCSGLFSSAEGGLVALITCDGNGQRIKVAYSEDEGKTWTKVDKIAADWTDDPLQDGAFRDPKVFHWENKWFMVVAGGPLRLYSSDNLLDWECESTYSDLHTECPDLYPIQADDGAIKWVLSRGGRSYKIGSLSDADGSWKFIPDEAYRAADGVMNFGRDSYAAMTFYVQDFGSEAAPTLPEIYEINWMNTWDDYCNKIAERVGQNFNGTYNLILKEDLLFENGEYILIQNPADAYEMLRGEALVDLKDAEITPDNKLLDDISAECYEIVSTFYPEKGTASVGFTVREGAEEGTHVIYDIENQKIQIKRNASGVNISPAFSQNDKQSLALNADGSISLHIYVDRASVEVFANDGRAAGANQIFPSMESLGVSVFTEGGKAKADITIYPLGSIW
ncbi:MAG: GH32 C-terminal domain-containing protein [Lachnospiraceae bacterium]|nr:GH32 C-terminal domain-containing protein [Lachnospiraceae bacterium]